MVARMEATVRGPSAAWGARRRSRSARRMRQSRPIRMAGIEPSASRRRIAANRPPRPVEDELIVLDTGYRLSGFRRLIGDGLPVAPVCSRSHSNTTFT